MNLELPVHYHQPQSLGFWMTEKCSLNQKTTATTEKTAYTISELMGSETRGAMNPSKSRDEDRKQNGHRILYDVGIFPPITPA